MGRLGRTCGVVVCIALGAISSACGGDAEVAGVTLTRPAAGAQVEPEPDAARAHLPVTDATSRSSFGFGEDGTEVMALGPLERHDEPQLVTDAIREDGDRAACQVHLVAGAAPVELRGTLVTSLTVGAGGTSTVTELGRDEVAVSVPAGTSALVVHTAAVAFQRSAAADVSCVARYVPASGAGS